MSKIAKPREILRPKTHSEVLWHFTGGASWNQRTKRQSVKLKPMAKAFDAFIKILESHELRVGNYHESINHIVPNYHSFDKKTKRMTTKQNVLRTISTSPVCCVADIPLTELFHHAKRYGKIAIGF